ncbi:MAG: amidase [Parasphingorhabdus sp.]|jgi:amidase
MSTDELFKLTATEAVAALKQGSLSPVELIEASIARIEAVGDQVNALPIRCFDRAFEQARQLDRSGQAGSARGLAGLPIAVKDYNDVGGVNTTYGSPIFQHNIASRSDATVSILERRGAIPIAKSNVPEWAGGHTFNPVFGVTGNPWDLSRSAGGSSGGSAAALASGQVWLATGNDLGGSLRTPAGLNGVVGLRPSPGVVPRGQRLQPFDTLWVEGPMARNVADVALMLDAGAGFHAEDPLSFDTTGELFQDLVKQDLSKPRIAYSADLGIVPVAAEVRNVTDAAAARLQSQGLEVTDQCPDFTGVLEAFQPLRAVLLGTMMGDILDQHRAEISADIIGNVERGFAVTPQDVFVAERTRWQLSKHMHEFFKHHDVLICPSASIAAFPTEWRYVTEIDGQPCETYIDWFAITFALTMTACPVLSIPCGFTAEGLPVGLQLVGKPRGEVALLQVANQLESIFGLATLVPIDPRGQRSKPPH